ncbi:MAG TPA: PIG-L family deacetylase [Candidatus Eisenbacteria bacterium]|nr:PIG-L family deacetylase [Candidatus Eisenbacteria bacterium]
MPGGRVIVRSSHLISLLAAALLAALGPFAPPRAGAESRPRDVMSAGEIQSALERLRVVGSVLYVAAHPDDENTALITYLSKGRKLRVGYLSMTRGSGGQNLLGSETGEALGVIRTQELLAARGVDGAEQYFTRAVDFGYSKSADETMGIWGREQMLADVVWAIRNFRPDVIVTRFPTDTRGGHGHHQASAILAKEAFAAAADPRRFPEQLRTVKPWRAKRIFWNVFRLDPAPRDPKLPPLLTVELGAFDPLLGKSYTEISAASRSMHKSQGFGAAERRGPTPAYFELLDGDSARASSGDLMDGISTSWARVAGGGAVDSILAEAARAFEPSAPHRILPILARARAAMRRLGDDPWAALKRRELDDVIRSCAGLWLEAIARDPAARPGGKLRVTVSALNRSAAAVTLRAVELPHGATVRAAADSNAVLRDRPLPTNMPVDGAATVPLPPSAEITQPYWLRGRPSQGADDVRDPALLLKPENAPALIARFELEIEGERIGYDVPVLYRWTDRVAGERYRPLEISPPVSLRFERSAYLFPDGSPREVRLVVESAGETATGPVRLDLPRGWRATPAETTVTAGPDAPAFPRFRVTPAPGEASASLGMSAAMTVGGVRQTRSRVVIDYPHIPVETLFPPAEARLVRADVKRAGSRVGYVAGSGDDVPAALEQMGYQVSLLSDDDIESAPLDGYDAIVVGIRAYNTRPRLRTMQDHLFGYVEKGGTLVVQYNTTEDALQDKLGPYPFKLSRDRVTVEGSPVRFGDPENRILRVPNRIVAADFDGWVQERGLYFANPWDPKYETPLSMNDPGEPPTGGSLLVARYGKGSYIYTGISWFRQLPAGVPGAYRLFANLVGAGKE